MALLVSTRGHNDIPVGYSDALLEGLAPDGGLYVPAAYPNISQAELRGLGGLAFAELATEVKGRLIGASISDNEQLALNRSAFDVTKFSSAKSGVIAPVREVADNLFIQDLSLGPTAAFKDFGLGSLAQEVDHVLYNRNQELTILGATSGDTGSAAEAAFKDFSRVSLFMLSPEQGMSEFQRAQMGALSGGNIHNISVKGSFDDCQDMVKAVKQDEEFKDLGAVNSINWGRIVAQVVYYFDGYMQTVGDQVGQQVDFVVPTGNFGNVLSGHVARSMGLPIRDLVVATNENNVVHRLIQTGEYVRQPSQVTSSPSMDITKASNYERLLFEMLKGDGTAVWKYMNIFNQRGKVANKDYGIDADAFDKLGIKSGTSTHADRLSSMRWIYNSSEVVIDPHTADGVTVARDLKREVPTVCLATASPVKFEPAVQEALGFVPKRQEHFSDLEAQSNPDSFVVVEQVDQLKRYLRDNR